MSKPNTRPLLKMLTLFLLVLVSTSIKVKGDKRGANIEPVDKAVCSLLKQTIPTELIRKEKINLRTLNVKAVSVKVLTQIPGMTITLIKFGQKWTPLAISKELVDRWNRLIAEVLRRTYNEVHGNRMNDIDRQEVARDLCKLLVDPNEKYGIVLNTIKDIPTDYQRSDVYQDLVRAGITPLQIQSKLLEKVRIPIGPPKLTKQDNSFCLKFFTWHYFGGELCQWTVYIGERYEIKQKIVSVEVGSYDYFM